MRVALMTFFFAVLLAAPARAGDAPALIDGDATWSLAESPYSVDQDNTVEQGASLVIEAGVTVEMAAGVSLIVKGEMRAVGTAGQQVLFTGKGEGGEKARWGSVVFEDSATDAVFVDVDEYESGSILEWCTFEHGTSVLDQK